MCGQHWEFTERHWHKPPLFFFVFETQENVKAPPTEDKTFIYMNNKSENSSLNWVYLSCFIGLYGRFHIRPIQRSPSMLVLPPVCSIDAWEGTATLVSPTRIALHTNNHLQHLLGEASFVLPMKLSMVYGLIWPSSMTRGAEGPADPSSGKGKGKG